MLPAAPANFSSTQNKRISFNIKKKFFPVHVHLFELFGLWAVPAGKGKMNFLTGWAGLRKKKSVFQRVEPKKEEEEEYYY